MKSLEPILDNQRNDADEVPPKSSESNPSSAAAVLESESGQSDTLQQQLLNAVSKATCIQEAARSLAAISSTELESLQTWFCQRGESSGQVMLDALLDLELDELLESTVPDIALHIDQIVESTLAAGNVNTKSLPNQLQLISVPIFFANQRPAAIVALCFASFDEVQNVPGDRSEQNGNGSAKHSKQRTVVAGLQLISSHLTLWQLQRADLQTETSLAKVLSSNLREILSSSSRVQACSLLCTRVSGYFRASHVALFGIHSLGRVRLAGFSGTTQVDRSSTVYQSLQNVCLHLQSSEDADEVVTSKDEGVGGKLLTQVGQALNQPFAMARRIFGNNTVEGMVIFVGDTDFEKTTGEKDFDANLTAINDQMNCALQWHRSPIHRSMMRMANIIKRFRWWIAGAVGLIAAVGVLPVPYRMNCDCQLTTTQKRYVVAPFNGQLSEVKIQPGAVVAANDLLATMDDKELRMELIGKQSEFDRELQKNQAARAVGKLADARIAELESQRIQQELQLIQSRLQNQEIRSPIVGTIVQGDLRELQGAPVEQGQNLFEVAPLDHLIVEIALPEYQYRYVEIGQQVAIQLEAYPFDDWTGTIKRIQPRAEPRDGQNVFIAEVEIENLETLLRPGMKGHATICGDYYPLAWNWLHYPYEKTRSLLRWF